MDEIRRKDVMAGCLMGTAMGDALGLPLEGLSPRRGLKLFPDIRGYHLFWGRGLVSDDTEHACWTARALAVSGGDPPAFAKESARRLRRWILALPPGVGLATLRAGLKLWIGFGPEKSGVFSAGNGPAMRAPIIGAAFGDRPERMRDLVLASTRMTHTDPRAYYGALAVAVAARVSAEGNANGDLFLSLLENLLPKEAHPWMDLAKRAVNSARAGQPGQAFAHELGLDRGVTGFVDHTVPVVLHIWQRHPRNLVDGLTEIIRLGGDSDTTAAILGGILGAGLGYANLPAELKNGLWSWPVTEALIEQTAEALVQAREAPRKNPPSWSFSAQMAKNLFFLILVLVHGFRRLLPPY